jgi:hypothetical protein
MKKLVFAVLMLGLMLAVAPQPSVRADDGLPKVDPIVTTVDAGLITVTHVFLDGHSEKICDRCKFSQAQRAWSDAVYNLGR